VIYPFNITIPINYITLCWKVLLKSRI